MVCIGFSLGVINVQKVSDIGDYTALDLMILLCCIG